MPSIRMGTTLRLEAAPTIPHIKSPLRFVGLLRALPAFDGHLPRTRHREHAGRRILRNDAAGPDRRALADGDRRHQHAIGADARPIADDRAMLARAVVVG